SDRRAHGLRAGWKVVDLQQEVEGLEVPRGESQRRLFRVCIPHMSRPTSWVKSASFDRRASGGRVPSYLIIPGTLPDERPSRRLESPSSIVVGPAALAGSTARNASFIGGLGLARIDAGRTSRGAPR